MTLINSLKHVFSKMISACDFHFLDAQLEILFVTKKCTEFSSIISLSDICALYIQILKK